jgi:hypothetical protein
MTDNIFRRRKGNTNDFLMGLRVQEEQRRFCGRAHADREPNRRKATSAELGSRLTIIGVSVRQKHERKPMKLYHERLKGRWYRRGSAAFRLRRRKAACLSPRRRIPTGHEPGIFVRNSWCGEDEMKAALAGLCVVE